MSLTTPLALLLFGGKPTWWSEKIFLNVNAAPRWHSRLGVPCLLEWCEVALVTIFRKQPSATPLPFVTSGFVMQCDESQRARGAPT